MPRGVSSSSSASSCMASDGEPPAKRDRRVIRRKRKKTAASKEPWPARNPLIPVTIRTILSDWLCQPIPTERAICAELSDRRDITPVFFELGKKMPLPSRFSHLKRVKDNLIILVMLTDLLDALATDNNFFDYWCMCPPSKTHRDKEVLIKWLKDESDDSFRTLCQVSNAFLIYSQVNERILEMLVPTKMLICSIKTAEVSARPPQLHWQFELATTSQWPCKFHPDQKKERLHNNNYFTLPEEQFHHLIMDVIRFVRQTADGADVGVAVDPATNRLVAIGISQKPMHPLMHGPMMLIDGIARSQALGAWNEYTRMTPPNEKGQESTLTQLVRDDGSESIMCLNGIDMEWRNVISAQFPDIRFGARKAKGSPEGATKEETEEAKAEAKAAGKFDPYLGTGYDVYLNKEPCLMCAMALAHSRIRHLFYNEAHPKGACGSLAKLHTMKPINHHYLVFQIE